MLPIPTVLSKSVIIAFMTPYQDKYKFFAPLFFAFVLGSTLLLIVMRWQFTINTNVVRFKPALWYFVLPAICGLACWYWMTPRINRLNFQENRTRKYFQTTSIATTVLTAALVQMFITSQIATLTEVTSLDEIGLHEKGTHFRINEYSVPKTYVAGYVIDETGGRRRTRRTSVTAYLLFPMVSEKNTTATQYSYWYALRFSRMLDNSLSDKGKTNAAQRFLNHCWKELTNFDFKSAKYFERLPDSDLRDRYLRILNTKISDTSQKEILLAHTQPFTNDTTNGILAIATFLLGSAMFFGRLSFVELK